MDPDEALTALREGANRILDADTDGGDDGFAEQFLALDALITNGGFLPHLWSAPK